MFRKKLSGRKPRRFFKKRVSRVSRKPKVSFAVKKYVKRTLSAKIENKTVAVEFETQFGSYDSAATPSMNAYPMMPYTGYITIPQGVTQGTRVGNQIKIKRVMLNYTLYPLAYNATTNLRPQPVEVLMYLGNTKASRGIIPDSGDLSVFFQLGATARPPNGSLDDCLLDVNRDYWDVKKAWRHKIGNANNGGTGNLAAAQSFANNDFKLSVVRRLNITKLCPKTVKFNDSSNPQQGPNLFFMFQCVPAAGGVFAADQRVVHINYFVQIDYEDA